MIYIVEVTKVYILIMVGRANFTIFVYNLSQERHMDETSRPSKYVVQPAAGVQMSLRPYIGWLHY